MTTAELHRDHPDLLALDADAHGFFVMYRNRLLACKAIHGYGLVVFSTQFGFDYLGRQYLWRGAGGWTDSSKIHVPQMDGVLEEWLMRVNGDAGAGAKETNALFEEHPELCEIIMSKIRRVPGAVCEARPSYDALVTSNETLTAELRRARAELDAKHEQWQAATKAHAEERSLRQAMEAESKTRVSWAWGWLAQDSDWGRANALGDWCLVEMRDGEPYNSYHPTLGSKAAYRESFSRWSKQHLPDSMQDAPKAEPDPQPTPLRARNPLAGIGSPRMLSGTSVPPPRNTTLRTLQNEQKKTEGEDPS